MSTKTELVKALAHARDPVQMGEALAALRRQVGLSQYALAEKAGISPYLLKQLEHPPPVTIDDMKKLLSALGVPNENALPVWFLGEESLWQNKVASRGRAASPAVA